MKLWTCLALASILLGSANAKSASGDRVLVLVPKIESAKHYSKFLGSLETRGFEVSVRAASNTSVALQIDGERAFDHAILLAPAAKKFGDGLGPLDFTRFVDDGGNMVVAASSELSDFHRKLAAQFGVVFEPRSTWAIDHANYLKQNNASDHKVVAASNFALAPAILSPEFASTSAKSQPKPTVYFKGIAHKYDAANPQLVPLLTGAISTYSGRDKGEKPMENTDTPLSGKSLGLVSAFQTRGNARVSFAGSTAMFSDALLSKRGGDNQRFVEDVAKWTMQEKSVLRETGHRHHLSATGEQPGHYRVSNEIVYEIDLSVYRDDAWHPYVADDVQFEAIMLDPYIRITLNHTDSAGSAPDTATYHGDIKLPDRYGTFTFRVNYKRTGYSNVDVKDTVAIWPLRHDGYPRFLSAAYPYYTGSFVMVIGFLALSAVWLFSDEPASKDKAGAAASKEKPKGKAKHKSS
ncbi:oligosaccharyl transferase glycoprotein complex, beta subunit [Coemansia erecta]|uniref:Dolichyl-diphosphooligosaccharide--protein glycosyltransferase subunit WBP1 n=1 Tax=Coemansia erecta TaxID=147472 RepID=A0A9W7XYA8_9FUNG|nr:oligosaccharyl transferase glycoprotein complex, beta subunit [Coemansia erecta]